MNNIFYRASAEAPKHVTQRKGDIGKMVLEKVKAILSEQFDAEEDTITVDTLIADDLGADSLDVVDLLMSIEDEFEIEVPDDEIENIKTVGELVAFIEANT